MNYREVERAILCAVAEAEEEGRPGAVRIASISGFSVHQTIGYLGGMDNNGRVEKFRHRAPGGSITRVDWLITDRGRERLRQLGPAPRAS